MARTSSAVLAALLAAAPFAAAWAQAPAEQNPAPVTAPSATTESPAAASDPAAAQPQADTAAETPAPGTAAETPAQATPDSGEAAAPENRVGSYYTKNTHNDWQLRCLRTPDGKDPCELYQLLRDERQTPVAEISVIPFKGEAAAVVNFVAPLETDLQAGMGLQIDSGKSARYPFIVCAAIGCISRVGMSEGELSQLKRGKSATVSLLPFGGEPDKDLVNLTVSLNGFTAGFTELQDSVAEGQ